ncbi:MAG: hypothetical protein HY434_00535, partial [Candidatus Liptonbacteria bacterium]|nr:hypothetical protein [Candidatus Liptonbacteria bacterium]
MNYFSIKSQIVLIAAAVFLFPFTIFAQTANQVCSRTGYTLVTINGIFTDDVGAKKNKENLQRILPNTYKNEALKVDYLLNASHLGGLGDIIKSIYQEVFDSETVKDYDLTEMLKDASENVRTQKLLLVAHSQGNFYANSFYDTVADKTGGVPRASIGVYSVATPSGRVAGEGKWLTSDTDKVIAGMVGRVLSRNIMAPNTHIALQPSDDSLGHDFSSVYLKYRSSEIVTDIRSSLDRLQTNDAQDTQSPCIAPPKLTLWHKAFGQALALVDPPASSIATGVAVSGRSIAATGAGIYAGVAVAADTAREAAKMIAAGVALAKEILTGGIRHTDEKNVFSDTLSASLLAVGNDAAQPAAEPPAVSRIGLPAVSRVEPPKRASETAPEQTAPASPIVSPAASPSILSETNRVEPAASSQPVPQPAATTPPVAFGSVSETPPATSVANSLPSIQNFQASFSTSTLLVSFSWSPLGAAATTYKIKDTDTGSVVAETSSSTATS